MKNMTKKSKRKSYSDLIKLETYQERLNYLKTESRVGEITHGGYRKLNQMLYSSPEWRKVRKQVILRDEGDLGLKDYPLDQPCIHHINPISIEDVLQRKACVFDPENLISASKRTHQQIHYEPRSQSISFNDYEPRTQNDTTLWR